MTGAWGYVDVGARSIQHYISRTPRLKGQRGASAWLSEATSGGEIQAMLLERTARRGGTRLS